MRPRNDWATILRARYGPKLERVFSSELGETVLAVAWALFVLILIFGSTGLVAAIGAAFIPGAI